MEKLRLTEIKNLVVEGSDEAKMEYIHLKLFLTQIKDLEIEEN